MNKFELSNLEINDIFTRSEELKSTFATIDTTVTKDNIKEMSEISTNINKFAKELSDKRITWKKEATSEITRQENLIKDVYNVLIDKRTEIKKNAETFLSAEKQARIESAKEYFEEQLKNYSIYEFITFEKDILESTFETKGACLYNEDGSIKGLSKKIKDLIDRKLEKFSNDKLTIDTFVFSTGDSNALIQYQNNGYNAQSAINYATEVIERNREAQAFKEAQDEIAKETKSEIKETVKLQSKTENKQVLIKKKKNTTTIHVEIANEKKESFVKMLRSKNIQFTVDGE